MRGLEKKASNLMHELIMIGEERDDIVNPVLLVMLKRRKEILDSHENT